MPAKRRVLYTRDTVIANPMQSGEAIASYRTMQHKAFLQTQEAITFHLYFFSGSVISQITNVC